ESCVSPRSAWIAARERYAGAMEATSKPEASGATSPTRERFGVGPSAASASAFSQRARASAWSVRGRAESASVGHESRERSTAVSRPRGPALTPRRPARLLLRSFEDRRRLGWAGPRDRAGPAYRRVLNRRLEDDT